MFIFVGIPGLDDTRRGALLWSPVDDSLSKRLNDKGFKAQAYADCLVISGRGTFQDVVSQLMQEALRLARGKQNWEGL